MGFGGSGIWGLWEGLGGQISDTFIKSDGIGTGIWASGDWDPGIRGLGSGDPGTGTWKSRGSGAGMSGSGDWERLGGQIFDTFVRSEGWGGGPGAEVTGVRED